MQIALRTNLNPIVHTKPENVTHKLYGPHSIEEAHKSIAHYISTHCGEETGNNYYENYMHRYSIPNEKNFRKDPNKGKVAINKYAMIELLNDQNIRNNATLPGQLKNIYKNDNMNHFNKSIEEQYKSQCYNNTQISLTQNSDKAENDADSDELQAIQEKTAAIQREIEFKRKQHKERAAKEAEKAAKEAERLNHIRLKQEEERQRAAKAKAIANAQAQLESLTKELNKLKEQEINNYVPNDIMEDGDSEMVNNNDNIIKPIDNYFSDNNSKLAQDNHAQNNSNNKEVFNPFASFFNDKNDKDNYNNFSNQPSPLRSNRNINNQPNSDKSVRFAADISNNNKNKTIKGELDFNKINNLIKNKTTIRYYGLQNNDHPTKEKQQDPEYIKNYYPMKPISVMLWKAMHQNTKGYVNEKNGKAFGISTAPRKFFDNIQPSDAKYRISDQMSSFNPEDIVANEAKELKASYGRLQGKSSNSTLLMRCITFNDYQDKNFIPIPGSGFYIDANYVPKLNNFGKFFGDLFDIPKDWNCCLNIVARYNPNSNNDNIIHRHGWGRIFDRQVPMGLLTHNGMEVLYFHQYATKKDVRDPNIKVSEDIKIEIDESKMIILSGNLDTLTWVVPATPYNKDVPQIYTVMGRASSYQEQNEIDVHTFKEKQKRQRMLSQQQQNSMNATSRLFGDIQVGYKRSYGNLDTRSFGNRFNNYNNNNNYQRRNNYQRGNFKRNNNRFNNYNNNNNYQRRPYGQNYQNANRNMNNNNYENGPQSYKNVASQSMDNHGYSEMGGR